MKFPRSTHERVLAVLAAVCLTAIGSLLGGVALAKSGDTTLRAEPPPGYEECEKDPAVCGIDPSGIAWPLATPADPDTHLITQAELEEKFELTGLRYGAERMTYGEALKLNDTPAAATDTVASPSRVVWVFTLYTDKLISDQCAGYGPPGSEDVCQDRPVYSFTNVVDAADGRGIDSCTGCSTIPEGARGEQ